MLPSLAESGPIEIRANKYRQTEDGIPIDKSDSDASNEENKEYSLNTNLCISDTALTGQHGSIEVSTTNQATPGQVASHAQASSGSSAAENNRLCKGVSNSRQYVDSL